MVTVHLFCAAVFIGIVAFEVLVLEGVRQHLPVSHMALVEEGIHRRGRRVMPWFVGLLFASGVTMAVFSYGQSLASPWSSPLGTLLALKITLAASVLVHFILAMKHAICGTMSSKRFKYTHLSVFIHMVLIVFLAKGMFYLRW
ncbi:MAG: CopD family copper resistance protein [Rhodoferax sp.]